MIRWGRFAAAYALLALLAAVLATTFHGSPTTVPDGWLELDATTSHAYSLLLGVSTGAFLVLATRLLVARFDWARQLHRELRPVARNLSPAGIVALAITSSLGEELLFRGLLQPWIGVAPQAVLFGLAHQVRGPSRWVWICWAGTIGLGFGAMFQLTGSLLGPIAAHAIVNGFNLFFLKSHDPAPRPRALGGLLGGRP